MTSELKKINLSGTGGKINLKTMMWLMGFYLLFIFF
jgi:hypothetical protein